MFSYKTSVSLFYVYSLFLSQNASQGFILDRSLRRNSPVAPLRYRQNPDEPFLEACKESEARLVILQITDVYTLENFASFKTLLEEAKRQAAGAKVVCMLTGDFLSPYLLSCVDHGAGMMNALGKIPLDYLTWGNHEADIDHRTVCQHVRNFPGKFINSNMIDHEAMDAQQEYDVLSVSSPDGSNTRKIGLCAVLSDDPKLYEHFKAPGMSGAFGGATVTNPWEALTKYKALLEGPEHKCDVVVPLQHLYVPDDHITCENFDFPVILSGHDHHLVDETVHGTRLLKPGSNAEYATLLELSWKDKDQSSKPSIRSRFIECRHFEPDPVLAEENERAYDALLPLQNTELATVPKSFEPLSSNKSRESVCNMGRFICHLIKSSMNISRNQRNHNVDAVLLMGGNIRGNADYAEGSFFSLEALEAEIKSDEVIAVVPMPGWLLAEGIQYTHAGEPIPGWIQYDGDVVEDTSAHPPVVTHVAGKPIVLNRIYRVATKISDLTNGQCQPWTDYYKTHTELLPPKGAYVNIHAELMSYFARSLWRKLWNAISDEVDDEACMLREECNESFNPEGFLDVLDLTGDGNVSVEEIQIALQEKLGLSVDNRETALAKFIHSFADTNGDGTVTLHDFKVFCKEMQQDENDQLQLTEYPRPPTQIMRELQAYYKNSAKETAMTALV